MTNKECVAGIRKACGEIGSLIDGYQNGNYQRYDNPEDNLFGDILEMVSQIRSFCNYVKDELPPLNTVDVSFKAMCIIAECMKWKTINDISKRVEEQISDQDDQMKTIQEIHKLIHKYG